ncbi:TonB-dependent receptor [Paucibacter sp. M5-1]|uniref:TonB-dependent receptor n=1 Tax=Paucibacter sp. M5-1 TaxID=3015998 RepID=UPI0022B8FB0C|nr:TonB-dependent receptor [Paucibacter sp. M5-1]MCZ7880517.1 TonB-dependent receptor [Paucibacter sp. M5-1]MCZ7880562.1 TonB-dependent receptor [Paucibacter sp. M5-1]
MIGKFLPRASTYHSVLRDGAFVALMLGCNLACAADEPAGARYRIEQPSQPLADSLRAIGRQTGVSVLFDPVKLGDRTSRAVSGQLTAVEAIAQALEGSGFELTQMPGGAVVVKARLSPGPAPAALPGQFPAGQAGSVGAEKPGRMEEAGGSAGPVVQASPVTPADKGGASLVEAPVSLTRVEVTGTRLKLIDSYGPTPVNVYSRADIERSGQPSLERFLSSLNEAAMSPGEGTLGVTNGQGAVQLRGLPLGSTLVLINGRRVQVSGASGSRFFNLNLIPMAAVERVEIVPVGSSAVYGGDALAGVVNIILKKQIDGIALDARVGSAKGAGDGSISLATGGGDASSSYLVLGSYRKTTPLTMAERDFFLDADYRRMGGVDSRARYCTPGTVSSNSSANLPGLNSSFAAIPPRGTGQGLSIADFAATAGQANLCSSYATGKGYVLAHGTETLGLHAAGDFQFRGGWSAFGELTLSKDRLRAEETGILMANVLVPASNAFNPFGVAVRVSSRLGAENGVETLQRDTKFARALLGVRGEMLPGWELEATASSTLDDGQHRTWNVTANAAARTAALASSDPAQALNLFTAGRAASDEVLTAIFPGVVRNDEGRKDQVGAFLRGSPLNLPAGPVDVIIGGEAARDRYLSQIVGGTRSGGNRSSSAVYGEARVPLWREGAGASGAGSKAWDLATLTLAARRDVYSDFGGANTYQAGLEIRPVRSMLLRGSAASSFKPPTLVQMNINNVSLTTDAYGIRDPQRGNALVTGGEVLRTANRDLGPEKGNAYSLGAVWEPASLSGTRFGVTAWQVKIDGLIGLLWPQTAVDNEAQFPGFVTRAPASGGVPGQITRVLYSEVNYGRLETSGADMEIAHAWKSGATKWSASASATRTRQYDVALTPGAAASSRLGVRAVDYWAPKWKGRLQLAVEQGPWGVGLTNRYLGAYRDSGAEGRRLGGYWLHDVAASVNLKRLGLGSGLSAGLSGVKDARLSLAIANLADRLPEYVGSSPYYDVTQADWRGRYASLQLSVSW